MLHVSNSISDSASPLLPSGGARFFLPTFHFHSSERFRTLFEAATALERAWKILLYPPWRLNAAGRHAKSFLNEVETHYKRCHSPKWYAHQLNLSMTNLRKVCQDALGRCPFDCIHLRLWLEAIRMLEGTDLQVRQIAWALGFEDPNYFSRLFKKSTGWTPTGLGALLR